MDMKEPLIKANRVFKYSITFQETNDESRELSDFSDSGFIIENETDEIGDILKLAQQTYGIYYPISFGGWESTTPEHNAKYFEKGIETYYALFIKNEDGTAITEEEYDFITFLLSDGNYNKSEFTDYAVGGVVLGALALGVGGLIAYYYFNKQVPARNRKYVNGGDVREMDWYKGFKKTRPFEMVVVTKEAEKDGGNEIIFNVIVEAQNDTLAYQEARKKWQMENGLSDLSIVKVYTKDEYVNSKKMANGGTTTTRPTTTPEVVPDTDTKPRKPKTPYTPKHTPLIKPKARKYDFILIKK